MSELIDKISSYHIFNYLLPGILLSIIVEKITIYSIIQENLIIGAFLYYFIGLVISRFGSLILEPFLKKIKYVKFAEYSEFIKASKNDSKIEILSETNNMYRTFSSLFVIIILIKLYEFIFLKFSISMNWNIYIFITILLIMFLWSYKKQTSYIAKRVEMDLKINQNIN